MTPKCPDCKRYQDDCICASPASAPEGFVLVPVEPTNEMTFIGQSHRYDATWSVGAIYREMLAAAPTPPVSEDRWLSVKDRLPAASKYRNLKLQMQEIINVC